MKIVQRYTFLVFALFSMNGYAADLTEFIEDDVISSAAVNANFSALNDEIQELNGGIQEGSGFVLIGNTLIAYGSFSINREPYRSSKQVNFPRSFVGAPVITTGFKNRDDPGYLEGNPHVSSSNSTSATLAWSTEGASIIYWQAIGKAVIQQTESNP